MDVRFYATPAGTVPVKDYLRPLDVKQRRMVGGVIRSIQNGGPLPGSAKFHGRHAPLAELSIGYHRVFYVMKGSTMWLLHAFQKNTQKTPHSEEKVALARMAEVLAMKE